MKIRYFAMLAVISLLSFGAIAGCSESKTSVAPSSPSAEVATNPCTGKANPCASKANAKAQSVGAPLAQSLQGKPVVIDVFATWCPDCKNIAPTLSQLKKDYGDKAHFVVLDVSDKSTTTKAEATANQLGLSQFLEVNKTQTGSGVVLQQYFFKEPLSGFEAAQYIPIYIIL